MATIKGVARFCDLRKTHRSPSRESRRPVRAASNKRQLHEGTEIRNGSLESGIWVRFRGGVIEGATSESGQTETKQGSPEHVSLPLNCGRIDAVPRTVKK